VDAQRLAKLQGWDLIFTNMDSEQLAPEQPCYSLFASSHPEPPSFMSDKLVPAEKNAAAAGATASPSGAYRPAVPAGNTGGSTTAGASAGGTGSGRKKEAVLAVRGTQTIQDVVTDIRTAPQMFPPPQEEVSAALRGSSNIPAGGAAAGGGGGGGTGGGVSGGLHGSGSAPDMSHYTSMLTPPSSSAASAAAAAAAAAAAGAGSTGSDGSSPGGSPTAVAGTAGTAGAAAGSWDWLAVPQHNTYACSGMVRSAMYVLREVGPALRRLHAEGYSVTIVGHSLGGAVAALMVYLLQHCIPGISAVTFGCPSCMDGETSDALRSRVLSVVMHDDVICRITPQSIR
jgi:hypothetical protein